MQQLSARQLAEWLAATASSTSNAEGRERRRPLLLDVREPWEFELCHLPDACLLPMQTVPTRIGELEASADIVLICHHGVRSQQVAAFLERRGFRSLYNLTGGIDAWADEVDPTMRKY